MSYYVLFRDHHEDSAYLYEAADSARLAKLFEGAHYSGDRPFDDVFAVPATGGEIVPAEVRTRATPFDSDDYSTMYVYILVGGIQIASTSFRVDGRS